MKGQTSGIPGNNSFRKNKFKLWVKCSEQKFIVVIYDKIHDKHIN